MARTPAHIQPLAFTAPRLKSRYGPRNQWLPYFRSPTTIRTLHSRLRGLRGLRGLSLGPAPFDSAAVVAPVPAPHPRCPDPSGSPGPQLAAGDGCVVNQAEKGTLKTTPQLSKHLLKKGVYGAHIFNGGLGGCFGCPTLEFPLESAKRGAKSCLGSIMPLILSPGSLKEVGLLKEDRRKLFTNVSLGYWSSIFLLLHSGYFPDRIESQGGSCPPEKVPLGI